MSNKSTDLKNINVCPSCGSNLDNPSDDYGSISLTTDNYCYICGSKLDGTTPTKEDIIDNIIGCLFHEGVIINGIKYDRILEVPYLIIIEYEEEYIEKLIEAFDRVLESWEEL